MFFLPNEQFRDDTRRVHFYQDKQSNVLYFHLYDPVTRRFYLFEGKDALNMLPLISAPKPKENGKENTVHIRITFDDFEKEKETANG